jgi:uncharacterized protein (DUF1501 family)
MTPAPPAAPQPVAVGAPTRPTLSRRSFLAGAGAAGLAGLVAPSILPRYAFATPNNPATGDVLVVVFLRGGADGLSMVAPYSDSGYRALRGYGTGNSIALAPPPTSGTDQHAALPLNVTKSGHEFGLHPAMTGLKAVWDAGDLAIVHAVGMPASASATRSHFEAQANWERGTPAASTSTGWLARHLTTLGTLPDIPAIGYDSGMPASLRGHPRAMTMSSIDGFGLGGFGGDEVARAETVLRAAWPSGSSDPLLRGGREVLDAIGLVEAENPEQYAPSPNPYPTSWPAAGLAGSFREIAMLIRADIGLRVACIDITGWDTHEEMGPPGWGNFRNQATILSQSLAAFHTDLSTPRVAGQPSTAPINEVTCVTMSEFGRTINVNNTNGTDHGRGSVMFVMGGNVTQGIHGAYPSGPLNEGPEGDLTVANDYRTVLAEVVAERAGNGANLGTIFPGWTPGSYLGVCA